MAVAVAEFQLLLAQLAGELGSRIDRLVPSLDRLSQPELLSFMTDAYPELVTPYIAAGNNLTTVWYDEQPTPPEAKPFYAEPAAVTPVEQLAASARWAMLQSDPTGALKGTATRAVFNGSRDTVITNTEREGVRWARHASANACGFCRMLATRGAVYRSQALAKKSHDHCHCLAVPDRDGLYVPAPYVEQWERDYTQARRDGATTPGQIANAMDKAEGGRRSVRPKSSAPAGTGRALSNASSGGPPRPPRIPPVRGVSGQPQGPDPKWVKASRAHVTGLTGRHRQSVIDYTGSGHKRINQWLRRGQLPVDPSVAAKVKDIDAVLAKNPFTETAVLTRTIDMQETFKITRGEDLIKIAGKDRVEHGYMSTTRISSGGKTKDYAKPVRLRVVAPRGTPAAAIEDISKYPGQGEVLLGRGLRYIIKDPVYDPGIGMWTATLRILP